MLYPESTLILGILSAFRWTEARMPPESYAYHYICFDRHDAMPESEVRALLAEHGFSVADMSYRIARDGPCLEYRMTIRTMTPDNTAYLAASSRKLELVRAFRISTMGD
jgi:putative Mg2+ transporter-C (MgtC) family protein